MSDDNENKGIINFAAERVRREVKKKLELLKRVSPSVDQPILENQIKDVAGEEDQLNQALKDNKNKKRKVEEARKKENEAVKKSYKLDKKK